MNELQAHIEAENEKHRKAGNCFAVASNPEHWASYGIHTIAEYDHYMAVESYIDYYKSLNGIKPRWINFDEISTEEIYNMMNSLLEQLAEEAENWQWCNELDVEAEKANVVSADPIPTKYELLAEQSGF